MTTELLLTLVAVGGAVGLTVGLMLSTVLRYASREQRRLRAVGAGAPASLLLNAPLVAAPSGQVVHRLSGLVPRSPHGLSRLRRRLIRAGYQAGTAMAVYTAAQVVGVLLLAAIPISLLPLRTGWPVVLVAALAGYGLPSVVLGRLVRNRQTAIRNGLPDALDLMIVCLESGSSIDQTIVKVSDELRLPYPALADELRMLIVETRAGKPRLEAFRNLAARTGVDDIRALVAMLVQTDRFGTSIAQALRTHAEASRIKRRQQAEENAAKIGVKLAFPLVFFLFPAFFIVTLGPAVIQFLRVFATQMSGR